MSSGFVSAGTNPDAPERPADESEWSRVEKEVEAQRLRKAQETNPNDGKSLYEANKAAKQDAFEEASRLKNQFRALDDDEVDFLDAVLESTRAKESAVQKETTEQLEHFRRQREQAEQSGLTEDQQEADEEQWSGRKRKKGSDAAGFGRIKFRKSTANKQQDSKSTAAAAVVAVAQADATDAPTKITAEGKKSPTPPTPAAPSAVDATKPPSGLGLTAYSDSEQE